MQILFFGTKAARVVFLDFTEVKRYSNIGRIYKAKSDSLR